MKIARASGSSMIARMSQSKNLPRNGGKSFFFSNGLTSYRYFFTIERLARLFKRNKFSTFKDLCLKLKLCVCVWWGGGG